MNSYIESLKSFLAAQVPNFGHEDANSILEMLYYFYADTNPVDNAAICCQFKNLDNVLSKLSLLDCEQVFTLAVDLCISHARQAFVEGVHIGMRLFVELEDVHNTEKPNHS